MKTVLNTSDVKRCSVCQCYEITVVEGVHDYNTIELNEEDWVQGKTETEKKKCVWWGREDT